MEPESAQIWPSRRTGPARTGGLHPEAAGGVDRGTVGGVPPQRDILGACHLALVEHRHQVGEQMDDVPVHPHHVAVGAGEVDSTMRRRAL